jgi:hypothetical protein
MPPPPLLPALPLLQLLPPQVATTPGAKSWRLLLLLLLLLHRPLLPLSTPQPRRASRFPTKSGTGARVPLCRLIAACRFQSRHPLLTRNPPPSGWLLKQRRHWGLGPDTHLRWFVLDNRRLMWFPGDGTAAAACFCLVSLALQTRSTACSPPHSKAPRLPAAAST